MVFDLPFVGGLCFQWLRGLVLCDCVSLVVGGRLRVFVLVILVIVGFYPGCGC